MKTAMLTVPGAPEIVVILLILLVMAGLAVAFALLLAWLLRRGPKPQSAPPVNHSDREGGGGQARKLSCPRCGAALPASSPQDLCPRCVLGAGLATPTEAGEVAGPNGTRIVRPPAPSREDVARRFPQLEILECLGCGGMGVVYRARQSKLNRLVALKILAPEKGADPKFAERFLREAQALARLNHPNIVTVHDYGEADGMFFLLMEFVDGMTLRQLLREGRMKPEQALAIVPPICEALQFAHEQGVVHRDIKPENVLLDKQGRVKIADFGIAKLVGTEGGPRPALTEERSIIGTPHYMAPEQVETPGLVDHRADIYSLGVVFYEMLTGELPLGKFPPPSQKVQVDVRLDEVVLHALEKEPERRYQHASEVRTDVETIRHSPAPFRQAETKPRCRIPGTDLALVESRNGQRRVHWPHVSLAWLLLMLAGGVVLGVVAFVADQVGFSIQPGTFEMVFVGMAFVAGMYLTIVVRRTLLLPAGEFERPEPRVHAAAGETPSLESVARARQMVRWPATGLMAIGLCFPTVVACLVVFGQFPGNWQDAFGLISALVISYVIILGSQRMRQLRTYRVAVVGTIVGLIVALPSFLLAAFPIWGLMVLYRPDVRAAFSDARPARASPAARKTVLTAWMWVLGSVWTLLAIVLLLGRTVARTEPLMYSFFDSGGWMYPSGYNRIIGLTVVLGLLSLVLAWVGGRSSSVGPIDRLARGLLGASPWLVVMITLLLGKKAVRWEPTMYAFYGVGGWMYPSTYHMLVGACALLALVSFGVIWFLRSRHYLRSQMPA